MKTITETEKIEAANKSYRTLPDGTVITWKDRQSAIEELQAFFEFIEEYWNVHQMKCGVYPIPFEIILRKQPETNKDCLLQAAQRITLKDQKRGRLIKIKPKEMLRPKDQFYALQSREGLLHYRLLYHQNAIFASLNYLKGRKKGWTLLGLKTVKSLLALCKKCCCPKDFEYIKRNGVILSNTLFCLLARRQILQHGKRTGALKSRTSQQRSAAAKGGWQSRKSSKQP